jgi:hypothetical protein
MRIIFPKFEPVPEVATLEEREAMFRAWCERLVAANPSWFLPLGVRRRWWNVAIEHPLTKHCTESG